MEGGFIGVSYLFDCVNTTVYAIFRAVKGSDLSPHFLPVKCCHLSKSYRTFVSVCWD